MRCSKCGKSKRSSAFTTNPKTARGVSYWCRKCCTEYRRSNPERFREANKRSKRKKRLAVYEYLLGHPCVDCGEKDPVVLDFDHVEGEKLGEVGRMLSGAASLKRIVEEIGKCEVRCANCHRRKTARELGYYKWAPA
jgi:hypothetical protein